MSGEPDTTKRKLTENISTQLSLPVLFYRGYQHTSALGKLKADQLAKEGKKKEQPPSHLSYRELLSITKRKPSATAILKDTNQTRTHSISCHDTNRPPSFASEQAIAD